jgi:hypothetical protein
MIKSKTYQLLSAQLVDNSISVMYNDNNIKVLSHSITSAGLSDKQFEVLADVYEDKDNKDNIVIGPVMYTVTFIYKEVYDIDMG